MAIYHKHAKTWAAESGTIMEDIITNFELAGTRLLRICPTCGEFQDKPYDLKKGAGSARATLSQVRLHLSAPRESADQFRSIQRH
jgi:hypothetical protein